MNLKGDMSMSKASRINQLPHGEAAIILWLIESFGNLARLELNAAGKRLFRSAEKKLKEVTR